MGEEKMFQEALDAIHQGQRSRARDLLTRLLRTNSNNAEYWLWMSIVVDTTNEKIYCLESALKADPNNQAALRGLIILGARKAEPGTQPGPAIHRKWTDDLEKNLEPPKTILQRIQQNPYLKLFGMLCLSILVIGLLAVGFTSIRKNVEELFIRVTPFPTSTQPATQTGTATRTLVVRSPTPTFIGPTPLWMFLTQTYTPVPLYVNTPHPILEAYRIALRAYNRGDYEQMLNFIQQASQSDPEAIDLYYYLGEAYRLLGDYDSAIEAYEQALERNPAFAPAFLGRARTRLAQNPAEDVTDDLGRAIESDPSLVDAYLERASIFIQAGNTESALQDLAVVESLFPESPLLYALLAQVYLQTGDDAAALQVAQQAYDLDMTLLPAYITLARASLANNLPQQAAHYAEIYLRYEPQDTEAWVVVGRAHLQAQEYDRAIEALDKALTLNDEVWEAYYYRGKAHLAVGEAQAAVNDLVIAVQRTVANFQYTFDLADALWKANRLTDAYRTFRSAEQLAEEDAQLAAIYYYRAQVAEQAGNLLEAKNDWALLLALPEEATPIEWRAFAQARWDSLHPPTATLTSTATKVPTVTPSPTSTPAPSITYTSSATPSRTSTPAP